LALQKEAATLRQHLQDSKRTSTPLYQSSSSTLFPFPAQDPLEDRKPSAATGKPRLVHLNTSFLEIEEQ